MNFVKLDDEILTMERRKAESLKTDKMRLEHLLTVSKRKISRITEEVSLLRYLKKFFLLNPALFQHLSRINFACIIIVKINYFLGVA